MIEQLNMFAAGFALFGVLAGIREGRPVYSFSMGAFCVVNLLYATVWAAP